MNPATEPPPPPFPDNLSCCTTCLMLLKLLFEVPVMLLALLFQFGVQFGSETLFVEGPLVLGQVTLLHLQQRPLRAEERGRGFISPQCRVKRYEIHFV